MNWIVNGKTLDLRAGGRGQVMGILNVTPDSFSDGGQFEQVSRAMKHAREMISQGAAIIDIGGESTRPGAAEVEFDEEIARTAPVIEALRNEWDGLISIDTKKASVAAAGLAAGADIVNDVSGLTGDPQMLSVCAGSNCGIVVMHMQGTPQTMQVAPEYSDVISSVRQFFAERLATLEEAGIAPERICFDPGIGFGKTLEHNLALLREVAVLAPTGRPLLLGVSRKSMLGRLCCGAEPGDRDAATFAVTAMARQRGVMLHRVHEVRGNLDALRITEALAGNSV